MAMGTEATLGPYELFKELAATGFIRDLFPQFVDIHGVSSFLGGNYTSDLLADPVTREPFFGIGLQI